jgi:spore photoproduct lyase
MEERVAAAAKVAGAGYPLGFIIAPIFQFPGWQREYEQLLATLADQLPDNARHDLTFEFITHRFTKRAKANILALFPTTTLPLAEEERKFKFGQFGYGKYIYDKVMMEEMKTFLYGSIERYFPQAAKVYFV